MIFPITVLGVEYATSVRLPPFGDAPATAVTPSAAASTAKANEMRLIYLPYLSTFSTDLMENTITVRPCQGQNRTGWRGEVTRRRRARRCRPDVHSWCLPGL